jgi:hypothetical protein
MTNNAINNLKSSGEAANYCSRKTAGNATQSCENHFVEIEMVGEDGKGVAGIECLLTLPDGTEMTFITNPLGIIRIGGVDPGSCQVTLPKLDQAAWEPILR